MQDYASTIQSQVPVLQSTLKLMLLVIGLCAAVSYIVFFASKGKIVLPGDYYIIKAPKRIYIPFGSTLIYSFVLYLMLKTSLGYIALTLAALYIFYRVILRNKPL